MIIDLERGQLLEPMFALPFEFAVPDLLFERELAEPLGEALIALGLRVEELQPGQVARARPFSSGGRCRCPTARLEVATPAALSAGR